MFNTIVAPRVSFWRVVLGSVSKLLLTTNHSFGWLLPDVLWNRCFWLLNLQTSSKRDSLRNPDFYCSPWETAHSFLVCFWKIRCVVNAPSLPWFRSQPASRPPNSASLEREILVGAFLHDLCTSCHTLSLPGLRSLFAVLLWSISKNLHLSLNVTVAIRYRSFSDDLKKHYCTNISRKVMVPLIWVIFFPPALGCDFWSEYCFLLLIGKDRGNPM